MLPNELWKEWEPRVYFPALAGAQSSFEFTVQPTLNNNLKHNLLMPGYYAYQKSKSWGHAWEDYKSFFLNKGIKFSVYRLTTDGKFLEKVMTSSEIAVGESFAYTHDLSKGQNDEMILFVASRGRPDKFSSSPGNMTVRYVTDKNVSGYRTGFFARPLNSKKGHYGYTGLNPAVSFNGDINSGLLLINHSSDPGYDQAVNPSLKLYSSPSEVSEVSFGEIAPHGFKEVIFEKVFPQLRDWKSKGKNFWIICECKGVTLASFHTYRNNEGRLLAIEHSRPSHTQVIDYWKKK